MQAAARRPLPAARSQREHSKEQRSPTEEARRWLRKLLQTISYHRSDDRRSDDSLDLDWREEEGLENCWEKHSHPDLAQLEHRDVLAYRRELMLSALRTSFWRALAG